MLDSTYGVTITHNISDTDLEMGSRVAHDKLEVPHLQNLIVIEDNFILIKDFWRG